MNFAWYLIFNYDEFIAADLFSRTYTLVLESIGQKDILVTKGEAVSILYEGIFLPLQLNGKNPFVKLGETELEKNYAIYIDDDQNVFLGIEHEN